VTKFSIRAGDTYPQFRVRLTEQDPVTLAESPVSGLASATSVTLVLVADDGTRIEGPMTVPDQVLNPGEVRYPWAVGDTDIPGRYRGEVKVVWLGGQQTFPSKKYFVVTVTPPL
jgi:hypothetical protein